jgi:CHAT domain-containing protein
MRTGHHFLQFVNLAGAVALLGVSSLPMARGDDKNAEAMFERAALKQSKGLEDLFRIRRFSSIRSISGNVTCRSLADGLSDANLGYWPGTGVLVYFHEGEKLHSWLINARGLQGYATTSVTLEAVDQQIRDLKTTLGLSKLQAGREPYVRGSLLYDEPSRPVRTLDEAIRRLSELLIGPPIAESLKGIEHLIIVPTRSLGVVPFAMLRPSDGETSLIDTMSISIAPSLFDLDQRLKPGLSFPRPVGGRLASFVYESPLVVGISNFPHEGGRRFPPLPGVKKEVQAVANELAVHPLLNSEATKQAITTKSPLADLVYIASHGFADHDEGYLVLWPGAGSDGIWSGAEIHDVKFKAGYAAILSACQTGLGRVHDAGMIGVARSFQLGGMPRVVVSLWSVKDEETSVFMVKLVRNMRKSMVAKALRDTMLEMRKEYPDPIVWASFSLFGTPR